MSRYDNEISLCMNSKSQNEGFARMAAAAFVAPLDPTVGELTDLKTAVSEAVTNCIIHGYENREGKIYLDFTLQGSTVTIKVRDEGAGIENLSQAMEPLYTSKPDMERSGMGFTVMEAFMDHVDVYSAKNEGTTVIMTKEIARPDR